ncbi:hypothetical protein PVAP13_1NG358657 [Panicum virgatum]|uniref:Uncharacterized protein n=1 Tax=Panicum virgatum TaxID=38727 RepID=A0A8T0WZ87_PANVG|nr:hypothetical protein PVAP13_1NG358657 [Panicum virgatum]
MYGILWRARRAVNRPNQSTQNQPQHPRASRRRSSPAVPEAIGFCTMNPIPGLAIPTSPRQSGETTGDARRRIHHAAPYDSGRTDGDARRRTHLWSDRPRAHVRCVGHRIDCRRDCTGAGGGDNSSGCCSRRLQFQVSHICNEKYCTS